MIPVWDDYIGGPFDEAIASLRAQSVEARIVVVDNASRVKLPVLGGATVVRAPSRLPLGASRNFGLERVQTPYVLFWDADDVMLPGTLELLETEIESQPGHVAVATAIVEESGARHRWPRRWITPLVRRSSSFALLDSVWSLYPTTGATIMRTELVRAAGGYASADSGEDWCLGVSLAYRGRMAWIERPGRVYRVDPGSVWARHMTVDHQLRHARAVRDRIRRDVGIPSWARAVLPLIQLGQYTAIMAHAVVATVRRAGVTTRADRR